MGLRMILFIKRGERFEFDSKMQSWLEKLKSFISNNWTQK